MSLDPHRASVVVDLLESATRAGALEKQEAAAILSSWIEEQKQQRSEAPSPGPDSEPSPMPIAAGAAAATMTIKTTTMTTTSSQSESPPMLPPQFPEAAAPLTPSSVRRTSRQLPSSVGRHCSVPSTPTAGRQFTFQPQQSVQLPSPPSCAALVTAATMTSSMGRSPGLQQQRSRRQRTLPTPMRSLFQVFSACAIGEKGDDCEEISSGDRDARDCPMTLQHNHRFCMEAPPPLPPLPPLPMPAPLTSSAGSDLQAYALYDPSGAEQHTYCDIDEADVVVDCASAEAAQQSTNKSIEAAASSSGTNDSGVYGSGSRVEGGAAAEAAAVQC